MEKLPENKTNGGDNLDIKQKEVAALERELMLILDSKINYAQLNRIDEIMFKLNEIAPNRSSFSTEKAWEDFEKNYLPEIDDPEDSLEFPENKFKSSENKLKSPKKKLSIIFGIILVFLCINLISVIAGINIFKPILKWTSDILNLKSEKNYSVNNDGFINFESLSDLEEYTNTYVPALNYIPENSKLSSIKLSYDNKITISYINDKYDIKYKIYPISYDFDISIEKTENNYYKYDFNNTAFYYFKNNEWSLIEWSINNKIYCVTGKFSEDESIKIIKNIEIKENTT